MDDARGPRHDARATRVVGPLLAVTAQCAFATKGIFVKEAYAAAPVDGTTLLALRMLYSLPFYVALAMWAHARAGSAPLSRRDWVNVVWLGLIGYYGSSLLSFVGLRTITAALERLVLFLYPTMVLLIGAVRQRRAVRPVEAGAVALSYFGISLVILHDLAHVPSARALVVGGGFVFAAALLYAVYLVWGQSVIARVGATRFTAYAMLVSTCGVLVHFVAAHPLADLRQPPRVQLLAFSMGMLATVLPTWLVSQALARMQASRVAVIGSVGPVATIWLGHVVLGEAVGAIQLVGAALVLGGVLLVTLRAGERQ